MNFFYPLRLGLPKSGPARTRRGHSPDLELGDDNRYEEKFEEYPESVVAAQLRRTASHDRGVTLITGEPGAGKSALLHEWHIRWIESLVVPRLGMRVPVLIRLKEITAKDLAGSPDEIADRLWTQFGQATAVAASKSTAAAKVFTLPLKLFTPVWLLDGFDEAPLEITDRSLWERLAALPGGVLATCRSALLPSALPAAAELITQQYRILGLRRNERVEFLAQALVAEYRDPTLAPELMQQFASITGQSSLVAAPLTLRLVAQTGDRPTVEQNLAGFYEGVINNLWSRRVRSLTTLYDLASRRDSALAALAAAMGVRSWQASYDLLSSVGITDDLRQALRETGLLEFDDVRLRAVFPHQLFQEFHLARSWLTKDFREVLEKHWADARYEEALALLVALHWKNGRAKNVEGVLRAFVQHWQSHHAKNPNSLWRIRRSPSIVALSLLARAGVTPTESPVRVSGIPLAARWHLAGNANPTSAVLRLLAGDSDVEVRLKVAKNLATPPSSLGSLAAHPDPRTRAVAAKNSATPARALSQLAGDPDKNVREAVATNEATPPNSLEFLIADQVEWVRMLAAENPSMPVTRLELLAKDPNDNLRYRVAINKSTSPQLLAVLANDSDDAVRYWVASNIAALPESLAFLAKDRNVSVRCAVAKNVTTPPETLAFLAEDSASMVRRALAENEATPTDLLAVLATDTNHEVRYGVAHAASRSDILNILANDADELVRCGVAWNPATPPEALGRLADDSDGDVLFGVGHNEATPPEVLLSLLGGKPGDFWALSCGNEAYLVDRHYAVAQNRKTPAELLASLVRHAYPSVRIAVAGNTTTPPSILAKLAEDQDENVRGEVAENVETPPQILAHLTRDWDEHVREKAAANPATLYEDIRRAPFEERLPNRIVLHVSRRVNGALDRFRNSARQSIGILQLALFFCVLLFAEWILANWPGSRMRDDK